MHVTRRHPGVRLLPLVFTAALLAAACGGRAGGDSTVAGSTRVAPTAALANVTTVDGTPFDLASLDGRPAVAWFWAPWCVLCVAEGPDVAEIADRFADRVEVFGVAGRGELAAMQTFVTGTGTGSLAHVADLDGSVWAAYGVYGQPAFAFIGADGSVDVFVGSLGGDALAERVERLLES
jgi:thiol-disulfide isomerase/thioredoxin